MALVKGKEKSIRVEGYPGIFYTEYRQEEINIGWFDDPIVTKAECRHRYEIGGVVIYDEWRVKEYNWNWKEYFFPGFQYLVERIKNRTYKII